MNKITKAKAVSKLKFIHNFLLIYFSSAKVKIYVRSLDRVSELRALYPNFLSCFAPKNVITNYDKI